MGSVLYENGGSRFRLSKEDIANLAQILRVNPGAHHGKEAEIIVELETACDMSRGKNLDRAFRRERIEEFHYQLSKFKKALSEFGGFIYDNFDPVSDEEIYFDGRERTITARNSLQDLEEWLSKTFQIEDGPKRHKKAQLRFTKGSPCHSQCCIDLANNLKDIFDHFGLRATKRGLFNEVLCACFEALRPVTPDSVRMPTKDPSRLIDKVLKNSVP